ncbi:MAG: nicotinamide riboside transporter PnuC [Chitinophagaceae bacterium]
MDIQQWAQLFWEQILATDLLQWAAVLLGVAEVLLAKSNKIALYPTGIAATLMSIYILYTAGLYAECLLNGYYVVMSVYGWWYWINKSGQPKVAVSYSTRREWMLVGIMVLGGTGILYLALRQFTTSTVPLWDSWVTATAWAGMWLLARRKIENWVLLDISNAFAIPLLLHKGIPLYAVLTLFLFIVAIFGYFQWRKLIPAKTVASLAPDKIYPAS